VKPEDEGGETNEIIPFFQDIYINFMIKLGFKEVREALINQWKVMERWSEVESLKQVDPSRFERAIHPDLRLTAEAYWATLSVEYFDNITLMLSSKDQILDQAVLNHRKNTISSQNGEFSSFHKFEELLKECTEDQDRGAAPLDLLASKAESLLETMKVENDSQVEALGK
jgi:hypothetical protein